MEQVWNDPELTAIHSDGPILFLESDHAVTPDFYVTLQAMHAVWQHDQRPDVWGISLNR
jgi:hypothetical protein